MPASIIGYCEGSIDFRTEAFWQAVVLRQRILRDPLGLALTVPEVLAEGPPMGHYGLSPFWG